MWLEMFEYEGEIAVIMTVMAVEPLSVTEPNQTIASTQRDMTQNYPK
jgi:hypothetical protein